MRIKKFLSVMLAVALLFSVIPITVTASAATVTSGTTGDCTWTLDGTHLTISGNGDMNNYANYAPWGEDVTSVTIEQGVTSIGDYAFDYCQELTSVTIPDSVTNIGEGAFLRCTGLTSITIPDSVTSIGNSAFYGCTGLTSMTIPDSVTSIGYNAFYDCTGLTSITIGNSVTSIDNYAFDGCANLKDVHYTGDLSGWCKITFSNEFSNPMFYATKSPKLYVNGKLLEGEITIPNDVTSIGDYVFSDCTSLTNIIIPDSVTSIGNWTFSNCKGLTSVIIGNSITNIGSFAFSYCTSLASIKIPDSIKGIGSFVFENTAYYDNKSNWTDAVLYVGNHLVGAKIGEIKGDYVIRPGTKSIAGSAFFNCTNLTSITIPDSVMDVTDGSFYGCTGLTAITVNENNKNYSSVDGVLYNKDKSVLNICPEGKKGEFIIPDSVTSIGDGAFFGCTELTSVTISGDVTSIGDYSFYNCAGLTSVTILDSVISIGGSAFYGCTGLTSITIPDSVTSIGGCAFEDCTSLTSVTIPDSVISVGKDAFYGCTGLTNVAIGNGVTSIDGSAFQKCTSLTSVTIGNSVTSIGSSAFTHCTSLTSITIPDSVTDIGNNAFFGCTSLTIITIPDSVTEIGGDAFYGCTSLTSITIPDSVTSIGYDAFYNCSNLVIKTPENSAAHKYAVEHNIKYELIITVESNDKNITISTDSSVIPSTGVSLSTEKVENIGEKYETQLKNLGTEKFTAYNIDLIKGEEKVQPNGKVTVSIAVPDGMDGAKCKVYRAESDGTLTDMKASLNDGKLTFTTDHFSLYIITQPAVKLGDVNGDGGVTVKDAIAILRHNAEVELLTGSQIIAGDLNGDGTVNTKDAILLLQYNAQIIEKFPIE